MQTMLTPDPIEPTSRAYFSQPITTATATTSPLPTTKAPTIGRIVNYVLPTGRNAGQVRPAIIVRVWSPTMVQLQVFTDSFNDYTQEHIGSTGMLWATSVPYSETEAPNTWHWATEATQFPIVEAATL